MDNKYIFVFFENQTERKVSSRHLSFEEKEEIERKIAEDNPYVSFPMDNNQIGRVCMRNIFAFVCADVQQISQVNETDSNNDKESALS